MSSGFDVRCWIFTNRHSSCREINAFWTALDRVVKEVPENEQLLVLMDANACTGRRGGRRLGSELGVRNAKFSAPTADILSTVMVSDWFHFLPIMGLHD